MTYPKIDLSKDAAHKGILWQGDTPVAASVLPEELSISFNPTWNEVFSGTISDVVGRGGPLSSFLDMGFKQTGIANRTRSMTAKQWDGGSSLQISLEFKLRAQNDAIEQVIEPFKYLASLALPRLIANQIMIGPSSSAVRILDRFKENDRIISLSIGEWLLIQDLVIDSASFSIPSLYERYNKSPIKINAQVSLMSFYGFTVQDVEEMILI